MSGFLIAEFDLWRPGYQGAVVTVYKAGTTTPADIFGDEALTETLSNPQTLDSKVDNDGNEYGRFAQPIYTGEAYFLQIDIGDDTGIKRPGIDTLDAQDASNATVQITGSSRANTLDDIVSRVADAENFGEIITTGAAGSAATNTTTIAAAIGSLGSAGIVRLPPGVIRANAFSIPAGVILEGQGQAATTVQIISGGIAVTVTGDNSGFRDMTLDGNNLTTGSVGVYALNRSGLIFENFLIKNFKKGLTAKGADNPQWRNFSINNCDTGAELHGDKDAGGTSNGAAFLGGLWHGGKVSACTTIGVDMRYVDAIMAHTALENVFFSSNPGSAVRCKGSQFIPLNNCRWDGNTVNLDISDDTTILTPSTQYQNKVIGLIARGGLMNGGAVNATGNLDDVVFDHMKILGVAFNLTPTLTNNLILKDCYEDSSVTVTGATSQLVRQFGAEVFEVTGITTGNVATRAWGITLADNQCAYFEMKIVGVQRNGTNRAMYHAVCGGRRAVGTLAYASQTVNFTVGDVLTGVTSGATARVVADSDSGSTGTLSLGDVVGTFLNGEIVTGSTTGSATVNGTLSDGAHAIDSVGLAHLRTAYETDSAWDISVTATAGELAINVTGNSNQTIDWTVHIEMVTS